MASRPSCSLAHACSAGSCREAALARHLHCSGRAWGRCDASFVTTAAYGMGVRAFRMHCGGFAPLRIALGQYTKPAAAVLLSDVLETMRPRLHMLVTRF